MITPKQYEKIVEGRIRYDILLKYETAIKLIKKYKKERKLKILDIGCGHGLVPFFCRKSWTIFEIDNNKKRLEAARKFNHKNTYYFKTDAEDFNLPENVNIVLALDVIEHLNNPEKCLRLISKFLDNDGILIVSNPNKYSVWNLLNVLFHLENHRHYWSPEKFAEMVEKFGFELMEVAPRPLLSEGIGWFIKDYRKFQNIDYSLGRLLPRFATGWFLVFKKEDLNI